MRTVSHRNTALVLFLLEVIFIVALAFISRYGDEVQPQDSAADGEEEPVRKYYASE